jgi:23S rRNA pseudouridine1911/1915/1917 synthase
VPAALAGLRLDQALARLFPQYSRTRLQGWLRDGAILVDRQAASARQPVAGGEEVRLALPQLPAEAAPQAERIPLKIVYEDADLLVIDKPAGLVVHPGAGVHHGTLLNALLAHAPQLAGLPRAGIVHRLDRDTSGLLVVAKTLEAQTALVRQLAERSMRRVYLAVVHGVPGAGGMIDQPIGRDARSRTRMAVTRRGREARTHYRVIERFAAAALVECRLETGRTHQIRVHLQYIGHPVVGDPVYRRGASTRLVFPRQALHARELSLAHPRSAKPVSWRAPLPSDMRRLIAALRRA